MEKALNELRAAIQSHTKMYGEDLTIRKITKKDHPAWKLRVEEFRKINRREAVL